MKLRTIRTLGSAVFAALFVSSAAFAQGEQQQQPQPTPDQKTEEKKEETPATPTTTPAPSGPTITLGTTPSKDTAKKDEKKEEKKDENTLFWRGTTFYAQTSMSTTTIAPQQQLTQASTVESWFLFQPQVTFGAKPSKTEATPSFQVRGRFTMAVEWTDTSATGTVTKREPLFGDSILTGFWSGIPEIPKVGIKPKLGIVLALPTSKASINRTMIVSPGITGSLSKAFEKIGGNEDWSASLAASGTLSRPIYVRSTPGAGNPLDYNRTCLGASDGCVAQTSGNYNTETSLSFLFSASLDWKKFSLATFFLLGNSWRYHAADIPGLTNGGHTGDGVGGTQGPNVYTQTSYWNLALDYNATKWLGVEVGYYMSRLLLDGNGRVGNPFFDQNQDMRVYLAANLTLDELYLSLAGSSGKKEAKREVQPVPQNLAIH